MKIFKSRISKLLIASALLLTAGLNAFGQEKDWLDSSVPSVYETYKNDFSYFGIACEYGNFGPGWGQKGELTKPEVQKGLKKHANTITLGNEFKPQFVFGWWGQNPKVTNEKFTSSKGVTITTPALNFLDRLGDILQICKDNGLQMRGHVLVWHSQTDDAFFCEDYNKNKKLVSKEIMDARQEWYIKTVIEYVNNWEKKNNGGKHIVWAWDVVNEAVADDATKSDYLRGSTKNTKNKGPDQGGSRWYQIYGSDEFIINAFRYANKYAPKDVKLCYNDYNEYMDYSQGWKTSGIVSLLKSIISHERDKELPTRIDVMGMQSHLGISWPGVSGVESAIKRYLALGLDIHVTELDFSAKNNAECAKAYADYMKLFKKYGKAYSGKHRITCVTIWGINDENSWIAQGGKQKPLIFTLKKGKYLTKDAYWSVINAAK